MKNLLLATISFFLIATVNAQPHLVSGQWEGVIILHNQEIPIEMHLSVKKNGRLTGFTSVDLQNGKLIEMKVKGQLHFDRSVTVREFKIVNEEELEGIEWYRKNFQLVFRRDSWDMTLNGFWQEQIPKMLTDKDKKGRVRLKKVNIKA